MIIIDSDGIQHDGSKHELILNLVNLIYSFQDMVKLDKNEIIRLEKCLGPMLRQEDISLLTTEFNSEQRKEIIEKLYSDLGIKKI